MPLSSVVNYDVNVNYITTKYFCLTWVRLAPLPNYPILIAVRAIKYEVNKVPVERTIDCKY
jgi:hypothetical protein